MYPACVRVCEFTVCYDCGVCVCVVFDLHCVIVICVCYLCEQCGV